MEARGNHHLVSFALPEQLLTELQCLLHLKQVGRLDEPNDPQQNNALQGGRKGCGQQEGVWSRGGALEQLLSTFALSWTATVGSWASCERVGLREEATSVCSVPN